MIRIIKQLFCKHKRVVPHSSYMEKVDGRYRIHHVWKCEKCGKIMPVKRK